MNNWQRDEVGLSAIVLAGGLSSRMGQDKALIMVDGMPLITRICGIAQQCADPVFVVTPWVERYRGVVDRGVQFVEEVWLGDEPNGSLVGFVQGLAVVQTEWVLLLACDLPGLRVEVLREWIDRLKQTEEVALLPKNPGGWWEPLCGFYRRDCLGDLTAYVEEGRRCSVVLSHQRWLSQRVVGELPLLDYRMLLNCNTPEDLRGFRADSVS
jgi:molybdenum cofactor guanylyltransferase